MQLAFNYRICFAFYYCSFPKEHHSSTVTELVQFVPDVGFFKRWFIYFVIFSQEHDSHYTTELPALQFATLVSFKHGSRQNRSDLCISIKRVHFMLSKKEEHVSSSSSLHFVPQEQNKLCTHGKNRKCAELWVENNLFNVFLMYALDSAQVKVRRLKRSRYFAILFDKPGPIERQVDPNTNLLNLIDSNAEPYMCRI